MIGYMSSAASVGFFSLPFRLVNYAGDVIPRVGSVTTSKIAELDERNATSVKQFTEVINRYCYTLFLPLTVFFSCMGIRFWPASLPPTLQPAARLCSSDCDRRGRNHCGHV